MKDNSNITTLELICFTLCCTIYFLGCWCLKLSHNIGTATILEFWLIGLIFYGIPKKIYTIKIIHKLIQYRSVVVATKHKSLIKLNISKCESINLLIYWADVIAILVALRLLQLTEHNDLNLNTLMPGLVWLCLLLCYWSYIVNDILYQGYNSSPTDSLQLSKAIDARFDERTKFLFRVDCLFWFLFSILPGPPAGGVVISLFMFTAVSLIENYTATDDAFSALWQDKSKSISLIFIGGLSSWLQWGENDNYSLINNVLWSYNHSTPPVYGFFYPLITYATIIIIAIWRGGERHFLQSNETTKKLNEANAVRKVAVLASDSFKQSYNEMTCVKNEKQELLSLLKSTVHNTKNEAIKLIKFNMPKLTQILTPDVLIRIENMAMSVIGMWVVVEKKAMHEMRLKQTSTIDISEISKEMVVNQLSNIFESALFINSLPDEVRVTAPDNDITYVVELLTNNIISSETVASYIMWDKSVAPYWIVCKQNKEITKSDSNFIPDSADIGLFRSAISEMIRNALRHNSESDPYLHIEVSLQDSYLTVGVINACSERSVWESFKTLEHDHKMGGGLHSLTCISKALQLNLKYYALSDYKVKISLGVKIDV